MRIKKLDLKAYGKFKDASFTLEDGLNIVAGDNEAGKSTVMAFIRHMMFGFPSGSRGELSPQNRKKYMPHSGEKMNGSMTFTHGGKTYTVSRQAGDSKAKDSGMMLDAETNLPADVTVSELLPVGEEGYVETAFIHQLGSRMKGSGDLTAALLNLASAGGEDTSVEDALTRLKVMLSELIKRTRTGALQVAEENYRTRMNDLRLARERQEGEAQNAALRKEKERRLAEVERELPGVAAGILEMEKSAAYEDYHRAKDEVKREEDRMERLKADRAKLSEEAKRYERFAASFPFGAEESTESVDWELESLSGKRRTANLLVCAGIALFVCFAALGALLSPLFFIGAAAGVMLSIAALMWNGSMKAKLAKFTAIRTAKEEKNQKRKEYLASFGCETAEEYNEKRARGQGCADRLKDLDERIRDEEEQKQEAEDRLRIKEQEIIQKFGAVEEYLPVRQSGDLAGKKESLEAERLSLAREIERLSPREGEEGESPAEIESELRELTETIQSLQKKEAAIRLAMDAIGKAHEDLSRDFAPKVNERASEILAGLTGGAHNAILMDKNYQVSLSAGADGPVDYFSSGTVDQVYFALRLAISELIFEGQEIPLILDDPFTQYDLKREKEAMRFLHEYAKDKQVILFTARPPEEPTLRL